MKNKLPDPLRSEINQAAHQMAQHQFNAIRRRLILGATIRLKEGLPAEQVRAWVFAQEMRGDHDPE